MPPGTAHPDSDLDFLMIASGVDDRAAERGRLQRPLRVAADVLVHSRDEAARWGRQPGTALKKSRLVHG
ncbi:hypothetical protein [Pseudorhodoferax sp.]|uniref:hypothetical protein n=1 Tax=Pseudorhodoferax sp. TaxID=1993553 RepID=UPI002DD66777|nr:hypothetical protein [Pseudorhodoferax sp.]